MARESWARSACFSARARKRDAARRLAPGDGQLAVQAPELRETGRVQPLALLGGSAQRLGRLPDIVLLEPGLSERGPDLERLVAGSPGCFSARTRRVAASAPGPAPAPGRRAHEGQPGTRGSIPGIQLRWIAGIGFRFQGFRF